MRDLKLLRETLTMDEIAAVLGARANMVVKKKGLNLGDLDFSGVSISVLHSIVRLQRRSILLQYSCSCWRRLSSATSVWVQAWEARNYQFT
jgi:hypothetical protein